MNENHSIYTSVICELSYIVNSSVMVQDAQNLCSNYSLLAAECPNYELHRSYFYAFTIPFLHIIT